VTRADDLQAAIEQFVPDGFRDEDGVWHDGPHRTAALAELDDLLAVVRAAQIVDHQCQYGPNYGYDKCPLCAALAAFEEGGR
jgi:hypothetical protein